MSEHAPDGAEARRDLLLELAREVVRDADREGHEPGSIAGRILAAWLAVDGPPARADHDFDSDDATGVEGLAFVISSNGVASGGLILRLPDELPDSFESVGLHRDARPEPGEVRRVFFDVAHGRPSRRPLERFSPVSAPLTAPSDTADGRPTRATDQIDTETQGDLR